VNNQDVEGSNSSPWLGCVKTKQRKTISGTFVWTKDQECQNWHWKTILVELNDKCTSNQVLWKIYLFAGSIFQGVNMLAIIHLRKRRGHHHLTGTGILLLPVVVLLPFVSV
jgi:hypothetical protein